MRNVLHSLEIGALGLQLVGLCGLLKLCSWIQSGKTKGLSLFPFVFSLLCAFGKGCESLASCPSHYARCLVVMFYHGNRKVTDAPFLIIQVFYINVLDTLAHRCSGHICSEVVLKPDLRLGVYLHGCLFQRSQESGQSQQ